MNVMALSVAVRSGAADATRAFFHRASAAVAMPALAFVAAPFLTSAWGALRAGRVDMDVPIAPACASSPHEAAVGAGADTWFYAAPSLTFFLLAGRHLDHRARAAARSAAAELTALELPRATVLEGTARRAVPAAHIRPGDRVALAPGARGRRRRGRGGRPRRSLGAHGRGDPGVRAGGRRRVRRRGRPARPPRPAGEGAGRGQQAAPPRWWRSPRPGATAILAAPTGWRASARR